MRLDHVILVDVSKVNDSSLFTVEPMWEFASIELAPQNHVFWLCQNVHEIFAREFFVQHWKKFSFHAFNVCKLLIPHGWFLLIYCETFEIICFTLFAYDDLKFISNPQRLECFPCTSCFCTKVLSSSHGCSFDLWFDLSSTCWLGHRLFPFRLLLLFGWLLCSRKPAFGWGWAIRGAAGWWALAESKLSLRLKNIEIIAFRTFSCSWSCLRSIILASLFGLFWVLILALNCLSCSHFFPQLNFHRLAFCHVLLHDNLKDSVSIMLELFKSSHAFSSNLYSIGLVIPYLNTFLHSVCEAQLVNPHHQLGLESYSCVEEGGHECNVLQIWEVICSNVVEPSFH